MQAVLFVAMALLSNIRRLRRLLTPAMLKRHRVRQLARHHYAASRDAAAAGDRLIS